MSTSSLGKEAIKSILSQTLMVPHTRSSGKQSELLDEVDRKIQDVTLKKS